MVTSALVNDVPQTHVELGEGVRSHVLGEALSTVEQQWLAAQINDHIEVNTRTEPAQAGAHGIFEAKRLMYTFFCLEALK